MPRLRLSAIERITLGLVGLLVSSMMLLSLVGVIPDLRAQYLENRTHFSESLAMQFSLLAEKTDLGTMRRFLNSVQERNKDLESIGIRRADGSLLIEVGEHTKHWTVTQDVSSTENNVTVQLFAGPKPWGALELRFQEETGFKLLKKLSPNLRANLALAGLCLIVYYGYLRAVLRHLNPSKVVPTRVREALDTLSEGLLILDRDERIVLANRAFETATGTNGESLVGKSIHQIAFISRDEHPDAMHPWTEAFRTGNSVTGRLLGIGDPGKEELIFSVGASPILDPNGARRGVLASFEDVSNLERKKRELKTMVDFLRESSDEIKRQNRELERLATRDSLTGCLNRRSFFERFDKEWKTVTEYRNGLSAFMVDIDHFKSINDKFGHSMGDEVLRRVAACLQETVRSQDVVCRYGGEEFSVLLPNTGMEEAERVAEKVRLAIQALKFPSLSVTSSLGVSCTSLAAATPQDLLDQADKCLYVAKRNGRNQVIRWDRVPPDLVVDPSKVSRTKDEDEQPAPAVPFHAVTALISALAYRDQTTATHCRRVADLCVSTAEGLLSLSDCYTLEIAALLHDIGKIGVPDSILLKPDALTDEEWAVMKRNDRIGVEIIRSSFASPQLTAIVENYHAHFGNPTLNPELPVGNRIPLGARILAIADAFDSMVTDRVYRSGRSRREAFAELRRCAGSQFDPELVERFISIQQTQELQSLSSQNLSKETALAIGLQLERLCKALDQQDLAALDAMSRRLHATANKYGAESIAQKASELENILQSDPDLHAILQTANELLDCCRASQASFVASAQLA